MKTLTPTQKADLEQVFRKAVPESMELKRGCLLKRNDRGKMYTFCVQADRGQGVYYIESMPEGSMSMEVTAKNFVKSNDFFEILGRPFNLQDVLIALNKTAMLLDIGNAACNRDLIIINDSCCYDLTKDYHHQSEEFYLFLHSRLCK